MSALRVLHVNTSDLEGGAARAANRIHRALRKIGVDSHMLVLNRRETSPDVLQPLSKVQQAANRVKLAISGRLMAQQCTPTNAVLHSLNWFSNGLADWINNSDFDIVNFHWLGGEMLSVEEIGRIRKPIYWTMHDMWPFSGAEHYDDLEYQGRYHGAYTRANRPPNYSGPDIDAWVWRRKKKAWAGKRFQLISPSHWLAKCAEQSALMSHQPCRVIPNCIDIDIFKPIDRRQARTLLNLNPNKRYILFGAMSSTSDHRKGFHLLQPALQRLAEHPGIASNTELLVFGSQVPTLSTALTLPVHYLGNFHDELSLALLYSAADIFIAPSMQDNLPNTLVEALACGTPCVAFHLGGMPDLIRHQETGWLASPFDTNDLYQGVAWILADDMRAVQLSKVARKTAVERFSYVNVATKYLEYYKQY